jgi:hypothetical protein
VVRLADLSPRFRILLFAVLLPGMVAAGWLALAGERQMEKASEFVGRATSVRIEIARPGAESRTFDIQCPDRARVETRTGRLSSVTGVVVGQRAVQAQRGGVWRDVAPESLGIPPVCAGASWARGRPDLASALKSLTEPGQRVDDAMLDLTLPSGDTSSCWRVHTRWDIGPDTSGQPRLCLSQDDYRPVVFMFPDGRSWTFSRWNKRIDIALPPGLAAD